MCVFGYGYCILSTLINDPSTIRDYDLINFHLVSHYGDDEAFVFLLKKLCIDLV